ncbi:large conductance mechanosensitive channel protein MscL [Pyruvatibacter mobilis]|uniref:Large-conductance mechanosensitive channel n=1 Tax=Pyruvatibacter mobilis TaxID=1712261 RepID=A0A845QB58_9HYPH|nr:large conductance mechanosensitive channel protein MscL [Pyruvatibacter mobilis]NBG95772.1 large conductance mechanosensitive channel protein MscL [Pyruvatibacter mobilis]QJD74918.1 large conductance mechanosensitive channel protein MscL [Pyruvatibacter mobilis]GGD11174.1 large-conductance mechanosensitive channel [Pyruvatibacter mobilis]
MLKEFREFISRGNVIDLAVGIVIGSAFTAIVKSLVNDVVMPPIGLILAGVDFSNLFVPLDGKTYESLASATEAGAATLNYGLFINAVISFLIVAFVVFLIVKSINKMKRKEEEKPAELAAPPRSEVLLEEIRDLLKTQRS